VSERQVAPSSDVAGATKAPPVFGIVMSSGAVNAVTSVPASAQCAVTSIT
jgi:hypothetical protein